jgi:plasmid maintenance system antidote protein VapI
MTPDQLRTELTRLGLTQAGAARFLKVDERTIRRWATGDKEVPEAVALLLPRLSPDEIQRG